MRDSKTVKYWLTGKAKNTQRSHRRYLAAFCAFAGRTPDEILAWKRSCIAQTDAMQSMEVEVKVADFLKSLLQGGMRESSAATALAAIRSYMKSLGMPLGAIPQKLDRQAVKPSPPTAVQLLHMVESVDSWQKRYLISGLALSGLTLGDFLQLSWGGGMSPDHGSAREQLASGRDLLHISQKRGKTKVPFDTFIGSYAVGILREVPDDMRDGPIVTFTEKEAWKIVHAAGRAAGIRGKISPHVLREYFTSRLRRLPAPSGEMSEYWSGHKRSQMAVYGAVSSFSVEDQEAFYRSVQIFLEPGGSEPPSQLLIHQPA